MANYTNHCQTLIDHLNISSISELELLYSSITGLSLFHDSSSSTHLELSGWWIYNIINLKHILPNSSLSSSSNILPYLLRTFPSNQNALKITRCTGPSKGSEPAKQSPSNSLPALSPAFYRCWSRWVHPLFQNPVCYYKFTTSRFQVIESCNRLNPLPPIFPHFPPFSRML